VKAAFSLVPEYLKTAEDAVAPNFMDYGVSLGRRFRALKLWAVMRAFGAEGLAARIREHVRLAQRFREWVAADPGFEVSAPTPLSVVCFRARFPGVPADEEDHRNHAVLDAVNASGEAFLSHTVLRGRTVLRLAIGNIRTEERHVARAWELLQDAARQQRSAQRP
jgi:aromatic-L-amino-acid decarboxylase